MDEIKKSILEVHVKCPVCNWKGTVFDAEPDVDGEGSPGCPRCLCSVIIVSANGG